jgi:class 3 adenylate cyclase
VTFLFTDVVASTRIWDEAAAEMRVALGRHDEILRSAIANHDGYVFSTSGDGFAAAFSTPERAVAAAVEAQQRLSARDHHGEGVELKVRMAVHSGAADERDGDYFGPALNRAARLMAVADGGQILVSGVVAGLLRDRPLEGIWLRDLGEHALRGLRHPERIFAVGAEGLAASYHLLVRPSGLGTLPQPATSFVGRVQEVAALAAEVGRRRLVTLVGPGGVGKTRLAVEVARTARPNFGAGALLADLTPLNQPDQVVHALAQVVGARVQESGELIDAIIESLSATEVLLDPWLRAPAAARPSGTGCSKPCDSTPTNA